LDLDQNVEHCYDSGIPIQITDKSNDIEQDAVNSLKSESDKNISKSEKDNFDVNNSGNKISEVNKDDKTENLASSSSEIDKVEWDFGDDEKSLLLDNQTVQDPNPDLHVTKLAVESFDSFDKLASFNSLAKLAEDFFSFSSDRFSSTGKTSNFLVGLASSLLSGKSS
jgi:hypothetical protein